MKKIRLTVLTLCLIFFTNLVAKSDGPQCSEKLTRDLQRIVAEKIGVYNERYPDIKFFQLAGGKTWVEDLLNLFFMLGENATSLDYEHPIELRETLMQWNVKRNKKMLRNRASSATLFRVGKNAKAQRKKPLSDYDRSLYGCERRYCRDWIFA